MSAYCTIDDVAALLGVPVESLDAARIDTLIGWASGLVDQVVCDLPTPTPEVVTLVTASVVARWVSNPEQVQSESIAGYRVQYAGVGSMTLTDAEVELLEPWACLPPGATSGSRTYTAALGSPTMPVWPWDWWQRDLDQLDEVVRR